MKSKASWHFTKWDGLNLVLVIQYIWCFNNFLALQIFFYIFLLKWRIKWRKFWVQCILWSSKILFCSWIEAQLFFSNGHFYNVVLTLPNVVKIYVGKDNLVSTLSNVVQINFEIEKIDSTLFNIVNFNIDAHNVVSTLIWRCVTSQRHINLNITLKQRWNVGWERTVFNHYQHDFHFVSSLNFYFSNTRSLLQKFF